MDKNDIQFLVMLVFAIAGLILGVAALVLAAVALG
jgi:hypothetical protein